MSVSLKLVLTTVPLHEEAEGLAEALVREQLAACVQIIPGIKSYFQWRGALQQDGELLVICKTSEPKVRELVERIAQLHSYETPEIVVVPIEQASEAYLRWVLRETGV